MTSSCLCYHCEAPGHGFWCPVRCPHCQAKWLDHCLSYCRNFNSCLSFFPFAQCCHRVSLVFLLKYSLQLHYLFCFHFLLIWAFSLKAWILARVLVGLLHSGLISSAPSFYTGYFYLIDFPRYYCIVFMILFH